MDEFINYVGTMIARDVRAITEYFRTERPEPPVGIWLRIGNIRKCQKHLAGSIYVHNFFKNIL